MVSVGGLSDCDYCGGDVMAVVLRVVGWLGCGVHLVDQSGGRLLECVGAGCDA